MAASAHEVQIAMYDDRRQHPRFPILLVAMAHTSDASFEVVCTNVSAGGAFLATRVPVKEGVPVELEMKPHGPDGPTVMLLGQTRYLVQRGGGGQPGFSVTWTEAVCPTSRLALEQVLRDILRVPRFRVAADGLGGRFRFGVSVADDEPEPPARVTFPPPAPFAHPHADSGSPDTFAGDAFAADEPLAPTYATVLVRESATASAAHDFESEEEAEAPRPAADAFDDFGAFAVSDEHPDQSWLDPAVDPSAAIEPPEPSHPLEAEQAPEAETMELSVAMAAALARGLSESQLPRGGASASSPAVAFDWSEFETAQSLPEEMTAPNPSTRAETATLDVAAARVLAVDPSLDVIAAAEPTQFQSEGTSPAASYRLDTVSEPEAPDLDDVGFFGGDARVATPLPDDDYFPDHIPEPEPVQRMTRNTVMRRLSGAFEPTKPAQPASASAVASKPTARQSDAHATPAAEALAEAMKPAAARPTSSLTRSFLAKVSTGEHAVPAARTARVVRAPAPDVPTETSTYADHDPEAHKATIDRRTDELHTGLTFEPGQHAPTASAPRARPPARDQMAIAEPRQSKPLAMVDAGQEVPRVMTESTVAYTRESHAIGPLLHAQTWPIEGEWPEMIPPSLSERYGYLEHIGTGGNGVAYRAVDLHLNRTVVLKFLAQSTMSTELARKYFLREVKLAASLNHPNIVHIYDIGKVDDVLYYAMEYVDGVPLSAYLPLREPIRDWQFLYSVIAQLCDALDHAHSQQILHRDIKPDNVLVAADGVVKLFDFGLARVADEGFGEQSVLIGTPHYMAPEQLMGGRVDHRTDIYALGVMLFRLVAGVLPFQDGNVFAAHAVEPVPDPRMFNPALPAAIVPIIEKAMAKHPSQRYSHSRELAMDLYAALFGAPLS